MTGHVELIILGMLVAIAGLVMLANLFRAPYPVFLLLGGLALGFVPGMPSIKLPPELVLCRRFFMELHLPPHRAISGQT